MTSAASACVEFAPAKVNLTLKVGAPRADGYHPLDSLVVFADWGDEVAATPGENLVLQLAGPGAQTLQSDPQNLVLKAAFALRAAVERPELGAVLTLNKRLPIAAGLGGGSADAAAALRALNRFWDLDLTTKQLAEVGSVVGADVPACVHSRPLRMTGIGDQITLLLAWPSLHAVIANPGVAVETGPVFAAYDGLNPGKLHPGKTPVAGDLATALDRVSQGINDLQAPAIGLAPLIAETLSALSQMPGAKLTRMSGSGASCFAIFDDEAAAQAAASTLSAQQPGWTVRAVILGGAV